MEQKITLTEDTVLFSVFVANNPLTGDSIRANVTLFDVWEVVGRLDWDRLKEIEKASIIDLFRLDCDAD